MTYEVRYHFRYHPDSHPMYKCVGGEFRRQRRWWDPRSWFSRWVQYGDCSSDPIHIVDIPEMSGTAISKAARRQGISDYLNNLPPADGGG